MTFQSFDTKDCEDPKVSTGIFEVSTQKFERFENGQLVKIPKFRHGSLNVSSRNILENGESPDGVLKVSTGKFESFESKDSEMEELNIGDSKVSTRKFESFESKDSGDGESPD